MAWEAFGGEVRQRQWNIRAQLMLSGTVTDNLHHLFKVVSDNDMLSKWVG